jgi:hypothetical protein
MNGNQQDPNMVCEVFTLTLAGLIDEYEIPASRSGRVSQSAGETSGHCYSPRASRGGAYGVGGLLWLGRARR